jgi:glycosyltransferase involved in cell wall biosynthesis
MPIKNAEKHLAESIQSIIDQSETNWELLAVDDHSQDGTNKILTNFAQKDQRIKVRINEGEGIIDALKTAYKNSSGKLIHRMDADDLMAKEKLSTLSRVLLQEGKGYIATAKVSYFSDGILQEGYQKYAEWLNRLCDEAAHWKEVYKECVIASPNWLIHKSDLDDCDAFQPNRYPEDYDLVFRFYQKGLKVISADEVSHHWRDHENRSSRKLEVYKDNDFFELKWHYFQSIERNEKRPLLLWGAGRKGKKLAKMWNECSVDYEWVSNNPKKHGKEIYDQILQSYRAIIQKSNPQIVVAVGQIGAKKEIRRFLTSNELKENEDFWFFC